MSILSIENLSYTYPDGQKAVLRDVSADFEAGKMYAITGPSGSGKSTLLSLLAGMETPTEGGIVCEGESLADMDLDAYRREKIAFVFQAYQLLPLLTARENVCLPMEMQGTPTEEASQRADALLLSVGLPDSLHRRFPGNLSGGEQQRVGIARSLASGAKVILADEPTGNLDDENTAAIMALLRKQVTDKGYCVIIVTHDPEVAAACDVCYQMRGGTLVESAAS